MSSFKREAVEGLNALPLTQEEIRRNVSFMRMVSELLEADEHAAETRLAELRLDISAQIEPLQFSESEASTSADVQEATRSSLLKFLEKN